MVRSGAARQLSVITPCGVRVCDFPIAVMLPGLRRVERITFPCSAEPRRATFRDRAARSALPVSEQITELFLFYYSWLDRPSGLYERAR
jgi:hypothetical protein